MSNILQEYLEERWCKRGTLGELDCLTLVADWIQLRTGIDPAEQFRGKYKTWKDVYRMVNHHQGWVEGATRVMEKIGLHPTEDPLTGDVGIIEGKTFIVNDLVLAIRLRNLWCVKTIHGIRAEAFNCLKAWRVP